MKTTQITTSEPKITIEMSLTDLKQLRDIMGAFSPNEFEKRFQEARAHIHPNFKEFVSRTYDFFYTEVARVVEAAKRSER